MVYLLFFKLVNLLQIFDLLDFHANIIYFDAKVGKVFVDAIKLNFLSLFDELGEGREGPFNSFDSHIIVHFFAHESGFSISFGLFADGEGV